MASSSAAVRNLLVRGKLLGGIRAPARAPATSCSYSTSADGGAASAAKATQQSQACPERETRPMPKIPERGSLKLSSCETRRRWVEDYTGADTAALAGWWGDSVKATTEDLRGNIEMPIGLAKVPLAVAGPLDVRGEAVDGPVLIPLATTEGALVASIQRGAMALNASGGVKTMTGRQHMTRSPFFLTDSAIQAARLAEWIKANLGRIQTEVVPRFSRHARLAGLVDAVDLATLHLLLQYETGDAAGQNMVTVVSTGVSQWIVDTVRREVPADHINIRSHYVEGNMSSDKKASALSVVTGRGMHAVAEVTLTREAAEKVLQTTPELLYEHYYNASRMSQRAGMFSFSGNAANVMAAVFAATGNDVACVGESAHGVCCDMLPPAPGDGSLKITYNIPSMVVGTVGGGTKLPTQAACLDIMGCRGAGKVRRMAEIVAAFCLGLDLSTMSAISAGQFAAAHDRLGRNRPT